MMDIPSSPRRDDPEGGAVALPFSLSSSLHPTIGSPGKAGHGLLVYEAIPASRSPSNDASRELRLSYQDFRNPLRRCLNFFPLLFLLCALLTTEKLDLSNRLSRIFPHPKALTVFRPRRSSIHSVLFFLPSKTRLSVPPNLLKSLFLKTAPLRPLVLSSDSFSFCYHRAYLIFRTPSHDPQLSVVRHTKRGNPSHRLSFSFNRGLSELTGSLLFP